MKPDEYALEVEEVRAPDTLPDWLEVVLFVGLACGLLLVFPFLLAGAELKRLK